MDEQSRALGLPDEVVSVEPDDVIDVLLGRIVDLIRENALLRATMMLQERNKKVDT